MSAALRSWRRPLLILVAIGWLAAMAVSFVGVPRLVMAGFDGQSVDFLNRKFENHRKFRQAAGLDATREWYSNWAASYSIKAAVLATAGAGVVAAFIGVPAVRRRVRRFFFASSAPMNLGIMRIVVFGMLLFLLLSEPILHYAGWPRDLFQWPAVGGIVMKHLPISVPLAKTLLGVCCVTTVMTMVGLFTRTSAAISVLLAMYLLGIPQSSGKVDHMHHVLLFGLIMALCRSGDSMSMDSIWLAIRRADQGEVGTPRRAVRYGLPLRICMALLALVYFFPGFWKIASNGPAWIFSDNLQNQMLQKWFQLETFEPAIPIHKLPYSSQMGALTAVIFEIGFPLAILWRYSRALWAVLGVTFHNLTWILMNISFMTLQAMYVMFVDWQRALAALGRRWFGSPMVVLYDNHCKLCRRTVSIIDSLDWLSTVQPVSAFEREKIEQLGLGHLKDDALMNDMHVAWQASDGYWQTAKGYQAYQALVWRVPKLWVALPFVYLPPVAAVGRRVYRRVADSRACNVVNKPPGGPRMQPGGRWSPKPLVVVAASLLAIMALLGVGRVRMAWPVACYPLFDQLAEPEILWPEFTAIDSQGKQSILDDNPIRLQLGEARYVETLKRFLETPVDDAEVRRLLGELAGYWHSAGQLEGIEPARVEIRAATYHLTGTGRPEQPVKSQLLTTVPWSEIEPPAAN